MIRVRRKLRRNRGRSGVLQFDRVALHLVIESGSLDAEKFCRFFLVPVTFSKRLNNRGSFNIVEALVKSENIDLIVIDSVAAIVPQAELEGEMGDQQMGLQAHDEQSFA